MKKILEIVFTIIVSSTICYSQPYRHVKDIKEIPRGWICVGIAYTQEDIGGGGWKNIPEYQIEDGTKYPKGKQLMTCLFDNLDRTEWNVVNKIDDCIYCYHRFQQGIPIYKYPGWTIVKVKDAPFQKKPDQDDTKKSEPYQKPVEKKAEEKFGTIRIYSTFQHKQYLYVYLVSSKADKIKKYNTGFSEKISSLFKMDESQLVYSNSIDMYFPYLYPAEKVNSNSDAIRNITLTEGTYKLISYDVNNILKYEKFIEITDGEDKKILVDPSEIFIKKTEDEMLLLNGYTKLSLTNFSEALGEFSTVKYSTVNSKTKGISIFMVSNSNSSSEDINLSYKNLNSEKITKKLDKGETFINASEFTILCQKFEDSECPNFYFKID